MERSSSAVVSVPLLLLVSLSFAVSAASALGVRHQEYARHSDSRIIPEEATDDHKVHCSRERSRAAWRIIEEYLMPFVEQEKFQMSSRCRLHPDNYLFRDQEEHKIHVGINEWRCGYCKKSFRAEKFLDQHFDNRHRDLLNVSDNNSKTKCNPAAAARNHHLCETIADNCFPASQGLSANRLHDFFLHQFCHAHGCSGKKKIFPRGGKKQPSIFYLSVSILTLMLLPLFYLLVYLKQREERGRQEFKRIKKIEKTKPLIKKPGDLVFPAFAFVDHSEVHFSRLVLWYMCLKGYIARCQRTG
ncbi:hypothetical protein MLD38_026089 [Melastoma candidum]|uniref:Uncharacterized protein n=1 Tax=Melastoma candidum TaxID=119954 RepID=A0ACB9P0C2_9MYRT|nr:hypothetical protein MLD38_026089 [Melastoma candidum]